MQQAVMTISMWDSSCWIWVDAKDRLTLISKLVCEKTDMERTTCRQVKLPTRHWFQSKWPREFVFQMTVFLDKVVKSVWPTRGICAQIQGICFCFGQPLVVVVRRSNAGHQEVPEAWRCPKGQRLCQSGALLFLTSGAWKVWNYVELEHPYPPQQIGDFIKIEGGKINVKSIVEELPDPKIDTLHQLFSDSGWHHHRWAVHQALETPEEWPHPKLHPRLRVWLCYHQLQGSTDVSSTTNSSWKTLRISRASARTSEGQLKHLPKRWERKTLHNVYWCRNVGCRDEASQTSATIRRNFPRRIFWTDFFGCKC